MQTIKISIIQRAESVTFHISGGGVTLAIIQRETEQTFRIDTIFSDGNGGHIGLRCCPHADGGWPFAIRSVKNLIREKIGNYGLRTEFQVIPDTMK